eukprot:6415569-Amphidinium_carterae.1
MGNTGQLPVIAPLCNCVPKQQTGAPHAKTDRSSVCATVPMSEPHKTHTHTSDPQNDNCLLCLGRVWPADFREMFYLQIPKDRARDAGQKRPIALLPRKFTGSGAPPANK